MRKHLRLNRTRFTYVFRAPNSTVHVLSSFFLFIREEISISNVAYRAQVFRPVNIVLRVILIWHDDRRTSLMGLLLKNVNHHYLYVHSE